MTNPVHQDNHFPAERMDDEIDLGQIFSTLWNYRLIFLAVFFTFALGAVGTYFFMGFKAAIPIAQIEFTLDFKGADKGEYPNGLSFDSGDLLTQAILQTVYDKNQLQQYVAFDAFRNSLNIRQLLNNNMRGRIESLEERLGEKGLSAKDRLDIQTEVDRLLTSSRSTHFLLSMSLTGGMTPELSFRVLQDILDIWADDAVLRLNVLRYRESILSPAFIDDGLLEREEYLLALDLLRQKINEINKNVDIVSQLPSGLLARSSARNFSLAEIKIELRNLNRFFLDPLMDKIKSNALTKDENDLSRYLSSRIELMELDRLVLIDKVAIYQDGLQQYSGSKNSLHGNAGAAAQRDLAEMSPMNSAAFVPQLGDSFVDMIMNLSGMDKDQAFRQELLKKIFEYREQIAALDKEIRYYESIRAALAIEASQTPAEREVALAEFNQRFDELVEQLRLIVTDINDIYSQISEENLNSQKGFFSVIKTPVMVREKPVGMQRLTMLMGVAAVLMFFLTIVGVLIHASIAARRRS